MEKSNHAEQYADQVLSTVPGVPQFLLTREQVRTQIICSYEAGAVAALNHLERAMISALIPKAGAA